MVAVIAKGKPVPHAKIS